MIHPILSRLREDKEVDEVDVRASQILERVEIDELEAPVARIDRPVSTVLRREVFKKSLKGHTMVRKLLVWKTNKEATDANYPAYVVHFTDYSPGRLEPLQREVRLAPTEELAEALAAEMLAENIKKGWEKVGLSEATGRAVPCGNLRALDSSPQLKPELFAVGLSRPFRRCGAAGRAELPTFEDARVSSEPTTTSPSTNSN